MLVIELIAPADIIAPSIKSCGFWFFFSSILFVMASMVSRIPKAANMRFSSAHEG